MRLSQRDIDALRIGIAKQEEDRIRLEDSQRSFERIRARERIAEVELRRASDLRPGDQIANVDGFGSAAWVYGTVNTNQPSQPGQRGTRWIKVDCAEGGRAGHAFADDDIVLIGRRS